MIPWAFLGRIGLHAVLGKGSILSLSTTASTGLGLDPVKIHVIYCTGVQRIFAFFGVITAAARGVIWRQAVHIAFAVVISGPGGDQHGHNGVSVSDKGSGGVERTAILSWRKGFGRRLLVFPLYVCNTEHSEEWDGTYRRHRSFWYSACQEQDWDYARLVFRQQWGVTVGLLKTCIRMTEPHGNGRPTHMHALTTHRCDSDCV